MKSELLIKGDAFVSVLVCVLLQVKFDAAVDSVSVEGNDRVGSLASAKDSNFGGGGARNSAVPDVISMEHTVEVAAVALVL